MGYRLEAQEKLSIGIKRIAREQADKALTQLTASGEGQDKAIHEARKCFKKIRAVVWLVRDEIGEAVYKQENICYRDVGRGLSDARDGAVKVETLDELRERFAAQLDVDAFAKARDKLASERHLIIEQTLKEEDVLADVVATLQAAQARIDTWPVERENFSSLAGGLRRVYKRGHNRLADAYADPRPEAFHDWRKRVKYLWYHIRILRPLWPDLFEVLADEIHDLSDYLGDDHDLAELRHVALKRPELFDDEREQQVLIALIDRRRAELEAAARPLGKRIYAEKPRRFVKRIAAYWHL
jgi:CHAD domain-containing protein